MVIELVVDVEFDAVLAAVVFVEAMAPSVVVVVVVVFPDTVAEEFEAVVMVTLEYESTAAAGATGVVVVALEADVEASVEFELGVAVDSVVEVVEVVEFAVIVGFGSDGRTISESDPVYPTKSLPPSDRPAMPEKNPLFEHEAYVSFEQVSYR